MHGDSWTLETGLTAARCHRCERFTIWCGPTIVFPAHSTAPPANPDLPDDVRRDYDEAASIVSASPRGAAALLRLAIEKLCNFLKLPGKTLNDQIGTAVKSGVPIAVQQALDVVRVTGNNAVHPGQIDLGDDSATATTLFRLVNLIAEKLITEPREVAQMFDGLPSGDKDAIAKRDGR
jgi:hypothetical protein